MMNVLKLLGLVLTLLVLLSMERSLAGVTTLLPVQYSSIVAAFASLFFVELLLSSIALIAIFIFTYSEFTDSMKGSLMNLISLLFYVGLFLRASLFLLMNGLSGILLITYLVALVLLILASLSIVTFGKGPVVLVVRAFIIALTVISLLLLLLNLLL
jgi:hypothetical protein